MYFTVLFYTLFLLGLSKAHSINSEESGSAELQLEENFQRHQEKRAVLRRVARNALKDFASQKIPLLEKVIIDGCKANGQSEAADKLQPAFDEMKACLQTKRIYVTPREEFLAHLEECSNDSLNISKSCLPTDEKYFPDLALTAARSLINFLYDDFDIIRVNLVACYPKINNVNVINNYKKCLSDIEVRGQNTNKIPSKAEFCKSFIPAAYCFTNMIKENCDKTQELVKYREDYIKAHKAPCED